MILALSRGELKAEETTAALSSCLVCRACHGACPVGVRPAKMVLSARNKSQQPAPLTSKILHIITNSHPLTTGLSKIIQLYQKSGLQGFLRKRKLHAIIPPFKRLEALIPAHRHDPIPLFPQAASAKHQLKAALLCGCMARIFHPRVAPATANLLDLAGIEVAVMEGFGCCGAPFRESGNRDQFLRQAKRTLDAFAPLAANIDLVLCDTSVCMITVRSYSRALESDKKYAEIAKIFSDKTHVLETLLADRLPETISPGYYPPKRSITFHDHCQTRHGLAIVNEPRYILQKVAGQLTELPKSDRCCGAGGDYILRHPQLSHKIGLDKIQSINESKAEIVVACNSGCLLNIERGLAEQNSTVAVRHISEALWQPLSEPKVNKEEPK